MTSVLLESFRRAYPKAKSEFIKIVSGDKFWERGVPQLLMQKDAERIGMEYTRGTVIHKIFMPSSIKAAHRIVPEEFWVRANVSNNGFITGVKPINPPGKFLKTCEWNT